MIFDTIVIAVLLISALHAFWRGFIREVLTIFGAIGGVLAALAFGDDLRPLTDSWLGVVEVDGEKVAKLFDVIPMTLVSAVLAYTAVFIIIFGVLSFISHLIAEQVRALGLGALDRTLGVVFGLARGFLILGIFYLPVHIVMDKETKREWFKESRSHIYVEAISTWLQDIMPDNMMPFKDDQKSDAKETPQNNHAGDTIDELKSGQDDDNTPTPTPESNADDEREKGYGDNQRGVMDTLIDKGIDKAIETGTERLEQ